MSTTLSKFIKVRPGEQLYLKISIGNGQTGVSSVYLSGSQLISGQKDTFKIALPISGLDLAGKSLFCSTIVSDIRPETNNTSVVYELYGNETSWKQTLGETVLAENDSLFYVATIQFYS
jgi:hypothetical protein